MTVHSNRLRFVNWRWQGVQLSDTKVPTAPDFVVSESLQVAGYDDDDSQIDLQLRFSPDLGRYFVEGVSLSVAGDEREITSARIRDIPLLRLTRDALHEGGVVEYAAGGIFDPQAVRDAAPQLVEGGPSSEEAMLATARVYRYAQILQKSPAKAVQEDLGLTAPTATLWIRRARMLGLLGEYGASDG